MSSPTASPSHVRLQRRLTGLAFATTAAVVAAAAWMTPRRASPTPMPRASSSTPLLSARLASSYLLRGDREAYVAITMAAPTGTVGARAQAM